jgi:RecJ-like exonuclease
MKITCPDCQGKGGWGHYEEETNYYGRTNTRARKETFFPCATCHGHGTIEKHTHESKEHQTQSHAR